MKCFKVTLVFLLSPLTAMGSSQTPVPIGSEFQVNTYATSNQRRPSVAFDPKGGFVVIWESGRADLAGPDGSSRGIQGQLFDSVGDPLGGEFQINTFTLGDQRSTSLAVWTDGEFFVSWDSPGSYGTDTSSRSVQAQRVSSGGTLLGEEFQVNTYTSDAQVESGVAITSNDEFVVVWESWGSSDTDASGFSIQAQRYDTMGIPVGGEFQVNTYTTSLQILPSVASGGNGRFVVAWQSLGSSGNDTSGASILGQRFDEVGAPAGSEFQVNTYTTGEQRYPSIASDDRGTFVVVWQSDGSSGSDTSSYSIQAQRYDALGTPIGAEFQVNTYTTSLQFWSSVAMDRDGNFVVVWTSSGSSGSDFNSRSIQGQRYDALGNAVGSQFQANTYTTSSQELPSAAAMANGDFVVAWTSGSYFDPNGPDGSYSSVQAQRFATPIFTDGFESGDTSTWSSTQ